MRKITFPSGLLILSIFFYSCSEYIGIANHHNLIDQLPRPAYRGVDSAAFYVSGGFNYNRGETSSTPAANFSNAWAGSGALTYSGVSDKYSSAIRAMAYYGEIDVGSLSNPPGLREGLYKHYGFGVSADLYRSIQFNNLEWRILGLQYSGIREFGNYIDFRQEYGNQEPDTTILFIRQYENLNPSNFAFVLSMRSEAVITSGDHTYGVWIAGGIGTNYLHGGLGIYYEKNPYRISFSNSLAFAGGHFFSLGAHYRLK